jgi:hypothetical protein
VASLWQIAFRHTSLGRGPHWRAAKSDGCERDEEIVGGESPGADAAAAQIALIRLHHKLRAQLSDLTSSLGGSVSSVPCPGHLPKTSDYTPGIVQRRFDSGVLVEVWGFVSGTEADLTYALLPLLPPIGRAAEAEGFYDLPYTITPRGSIADVFADPVELRAFTELSAGLRALAGAKETRNGERYSRAYKALCRADSLLGEAERRAGPNAPDWTALRRLAITSAQTAKTDATVTDPGRAGALARPPAGVIVATCKVPPADPPFVGVVP